MRVERAQLDRQGICAEHDHVRQLAGLQGADRPLASHGVGRVQGVRPKGGQHVDAQSRAAQHRARHGPPIDRGTHRAERPGEGHRRVGRQRHVDARPHERADGVVALAHGLPDRADHPVAIGLVMTRAGRRPPCPAAPCVRSVVRWADRSARCGGGHRAAAPLAGPRRRHRGRWRWHRATGHGSRSAGPPHAPGAPSPSTPRARGTAGRARRAGPGSPPGTRPCRRRALHRRRA